MNLEYLNSLPSSKYDLPIDGNQMLLPINGLLWEDFEKLSLRMAEYVEGFSISDCEIFGRQGQKQSGIDIYGLRGNGQYYAFQCKKYESISTSDLNKILSDFEEGEWFNKTEKFFICTSASFSDVHLQKRYEELKKEYLKKGKQIDKWDYSSINRILKTHPKIVYDFFGAEWCKAFCGEEVYRSIITSMDFNQIERSFDKASFFLSRVKNYFDKKQSSHIDRKETKKIIDWVVADLKDGKKNLLVLEGDKGMGKSVILKDVYEELKSQNFTILGIKADKYYANSPRELENKIFVDDNITFSKIIGALNTNKRKLVIIIDQLDALSQTLSSNREYIQTYNRIVSELLGEKNIRIIISSRSFDLKYDAELSVYKSNEYHNIKTSLLEEKEVINTLQNFGVNCSQKKVLELLRTPNQLEVFCKLPNKNKINLDTLSSLKDLYDTLWKSLIIPMVDLKLSELLYSIAIEMYDRQQIVVNDKFSDKYYSEIQYLLSNQLIIKEESEIQFFHQTFYDYAFSRQFVEKGNDIFNYLNENEQNLEVRSIIKMVFEYLREYDHGRYVLSINSILKSSKYRFHIKSLVISNLGIVTNPSNQEKEIFHRYISKNYLFQDVFVHSIVSQGWVEYLIHQKALNKFLFNQETLANKIHKIYKKQSVFRIDLLEKFDSGNIVDYQRDLVWRFFRNNINIVPLSIMKYLDELEDFDDKPNFNERVLSGLNEWEHEKLLPFFEKYITFNEESKGRDNFWYYEILKKIFEHHELYVINLLKPILIDVFSSGNSWHSNKFLHEQEELLKAIIAKSPEVGFSFILDIYKTVIDENKDESHLEEIKSPLYKCSKFIDGFSSKEDAHIVVEDLLVKHLKSEFQNSNYILQFFDEHKNSNSIDIIRLILLTLKNEKVRYIDSVYEFIGIVCAKNGFSGYDDKFQLYFRQVIGQYFSHFSSEQKEKVTEILISIKSPYDFKYYKYENDEGREKINFYGISEKKFLFIKQLPKVEIWQIPTLKKAYQEYYRKFGDVDSNKALNVSSSRSYGVGAPLSQKAYKEMDLENWQNSMSKFNDDYRGERGPKGGKLEHSRAFVDSVKSNPNKFYDFILSLFENENVSNDYISSGVDGLIQAKCEPEKVKIIYKKFIKLNLDLVNSLYAIRQCDYLIDNKLVDDEIIAFLSTNALNHPHPEKPINDASSDSLNSVRGSAIHRIMQCYEQKQFEETIFQIAEKAAFDLQISVRVAVLQELGYLNHLDLARSFKIFELLTETDDIELLKNSFRTSQYFNVKFHKEMYPYFEKIIQNKELHKDGHVIVLSWLNEKMSDKRLYKKFIKSSSEAKLCALNIAEANLYNENETTSKRAFKILLEFLNKNNEDFATAYSGIILRKFKKHNFEESYEFLLKYSKSKLCMAQPSYFLQLLLTCVNEHPVKCLHLIQNLNYHKTPNIQRRGYYDKEPVQLILAIYSKLNMDLENNRKFIKKSLDIFDDMLKHNHLRSTLNEAMDLIT
tara:strand:+ start:1912 stop:6369 length:4458 start_codon:yes stop_codon:yes gene_type:complete